MAQFYEPAHFGWSGYLMRLYTHRKISNSCFLGWTQINYWVLWMGFCTILKNCPQQQCQWHFACREGYVLQSFAIVSHFETNSKIAPICQGSKNLCYCFSSLQPQLFLWSIKWFLLGNKYACLCNLNARNYHIANDIKRRRKIDPPDCVTHSSTGQSLPL